MAIFTGSGVAIVTPFKEDLSVDYEALNRLIDFQIDNGTDSIVICGTSGESSTLTHEEHIECIRVCVEHVKKRVPVIAGTGSNCTEEAVHLTKEAAKVGADASLVVTPYYNKTTQRGLIEHYTAIAKAADIPMVMYNVPSRTGCNLLPKTAAALVKDVDNIVAIKEATGNLSQVAQLMYETQGDIDLYSGNDDQILPLLSLGGKGVISVLANIMPKETHDIVAKFLAGEIAESTAMQVKYIELINALFCEVNPIPVKKAVELMGLCGGKVRKPLIEMEEENAERLAAAMKAQGLELK